MPDRLNKQQPKPSLYIKQLSTIIFPANAKEKRIAMFSAYFDESGTDEKSPVIVVAGWLSNDKEWIKLSDKWQAVLTKYNLPYFRMSKWQASQGPYKNMTQKEKNQLIERLTTIIKRHVSIGVFGAFHRSTYDEVLHKMHGKDYKTKFVKPYGTCAMLCIETLRRWMKSKSLDGPLAYVFETGARYSGEFFETFKAAQKGSNFNQSYPGGISFYDKRVVLPLQAADILAYEMYRELKNSIENYPNPRREVLINIRNVVPIRGTFYDKDKLRKFIENLVIDR